jgi:hypothetical protein
MKLIPLTKGLFVQVDDWNYDRLMEHKWYAHKSGSNYYAKRSVWKGEDVYMHRDIMNTPKELQCDHMDHNGLNCLEENMRNCTNQQNMMNKSAYGRSSYLGVCLRGDGYISVSIKVKGKAKHIGMYPTEELAALAYDVAAMKYHGEFANLNFT